MKRIVVVVMCLICFIFGACAPVGASAEQDRPLKIWFENKNGQLYTYSLVDENTGVNYIVVATCAPNGGDAPAITPRLNADGSLYVTD